MPYHESVIALLRHRSDSAFAPAGLYNASNFGHPNQLFYLVGWLVSYLLPTDWTCKILVAATVMAIAVCAGRLATYLQASRFTALAVAPVALGWTFSWGLVTNLTGLAALLFALPSFDRAAEAPTARNAARAMGCMILLYLAHEAMMVAACIGVVIFALAHPIRIGATLLFDAGAPAAVRVAAFRRASALSETSDVGERQRRSVDVPVVQAQADDDPGGPVGWPRNDHANGNVRAPRCVSHRLRGRAA